MKKKSAIILASVAALCLLGVGLSFVFDWNVDSDKAGDNIAKSTRFSRKTAVDGLSNMQELLENDESFKNGMVVTYLVMNTRAKEFSALVEMSEQAAGGIAAFGPVLKDMKAALPMVRNVCASMEAAGKDLDAALGGGNAKELAQNTNNAALAYSTLQKQNSLADRFIETADNYFAAEGKADAKLAFVRDQWLEYQRLTAALNQDDAAAALLEQKGYVQSPEESAASMNRHFGFFQNEVLAGAAVTTLLGHSGALSHALLLANNAAALEQSAVALNQSATALNQSAVALGQNAVTALSQSAAALNQSAVALGQNAVTALSQSAAALNQSAVALNQGVLILSSFTALGNAVQALPAVQAIALPESVQNAAVALGESAVALNQNAAIALNQNAAALSQNAAALSQSAAALNQSAAALNQSAFMNAWKVIGSQANISINALAHGELKALNFI